MKLLVAADARLRTQELFECFEDMRAGFGEDFLRELEASYLKIEQDSHGYPRVTVPTSEDRDLRHNLLRRYPYAVIYEIRRDEIVVMAIVHETVRPV